MTTATDKLIDTIRKLAAKAASTDSEAEASAFSAKVQELLAAHGLSEEILFQPDEQPIVEEGWEAPRDEPWRRALCQAAARLYFCSVYVYDYPVLEDNREIVYPLKFRNGIRFVGRAHNVAVARAMSEYLISTTRRLGREYADGDKPAYDGFIRGCGVRLADRLYQLWSEQRHKPKVFAGGNPGNLPALYATEEDLVSKFLKTKGLKKFGRGTRVGGEHGEAGARAADGVSLNAQVSGRGARLLS